MTKYLIAITSLLVASTQLALAITPIPEPGTIELLALGGVVSAVVALRKRRNKK